MRLWAWTVLGSGWHDRVVARGDEPRRGVDLLQLGVGEQRWAARLKGLDNATDRHGRSEQVTVDRSHLHGHVAAVAAAGDVDPLAVDRVPADEIADDLADERGEAGSVFDPVGGALWGHDIGAAEDPLCLLRGEAQRTAVGPQRRLVVVVVDRAAGRPHLRRAARRPEAACLVRRRGSGGRGGASTAGSSCRSRRRW